MDVGDRLQKTVSFMMVSGNSHISMAGAFIPPKLPPFMKATGTWIKDMSLGTMNGQAAQTMKVNMIMARIRATVCTLLQTVILGTGNARTA